LDERALMLACLRAALCGVLLLGAAALLLPLTAHAQDPNGGLNLQNPYAKPNTLGSTGSRLNEEITPRNEDYARALSLMQDGRYDDAIITLNKLVAMNPIDYDALNQLGYCYQKLGQPGKAMGYYNKVLGPKPDHPGANENVGELFLEMKNLEGAEERLTVLQNTCNNCAEYNSLKAKIDSYKAQQG
jgi:tetratricopeptide (TPR) repeat protein